MKRAVTIVGGGQSGLQLGNGLLSAGFDVHLVQDRKADDIRNGRVTSSQCMFDKALSYERELGLNFWDKECPTVNSINFTVPAPDGSGNKAIEWNGLLDRPAQAVDQRLKFPRWMQELEKRGGTIEYKAASAADLEKYAADSDLVVVAAGKGEVAKLFERDAQKSQFDAPQRALALTYVKGLTPRPQYSAVAFNLIPGVGEYFVFPALTTTGPCEIMVFEGIPGGPMDCWAMSHRRRRILRNPDGSSTPSSPGRAHARRRASSPTRTAFWSDASPPPCADRSRGSPPARRCSAWPTWSCSTTRSPARVPTMPRNARRSISMRSRRMATSRSTRPSCRRPSTATGISRNT